MRRPKLSKSEQNLSQLENSGSLNHQELDKIKNLVSSEENIRFSKWESEICYVQPLKLQVPSQKPEIVMVEYGQEEII